MSTTCGFFNSVNGDRVYNADDISNYFNGLISNGVFENVGNKLSVSATTGMTVSVNSGRAFINCRWMNNDAVINLTLDAADVQYNRIDRIIIRLNSSDSVRNMTIQVLKGTNALEPVAPELTRTNTIYDLCLAEISVSANATQILQTDISDTRADSSLCGFVNNVVSQLDVTELYREYETKFQNYMTAKMAEFDAWFETLTSELRVDTKLVAYQNVITTTTETSELNIGISQYKSTDLLLIHVGGVLFVQGTEFTVSGTGSTAKITLTNPITTGNTVTIICVKSVVGTNA